jgi:LacI family transcriptional regulator
MPTKKSITIRDVAKEAGVSVATVSRYINQIGYISQDTQAKIQIVMDKWNFQPNMIARGLAIKKTQTIGLMVPDITNPFFPELIRAIEEIAKSRGYQVILGNLGEEIKEADFWNHFKLRYIDGIIFASMPLSERSLSEVEGLHIPYVVIDRAANLDIPYSIGVDNAKGAMLAVEHLVSVGCRKIAHITGPNNIFPSLERKKGYIQALQTLLPSQEPLLYLGDFTLESGRRQAYQLIHEHPDVDGIFASNDLMAIGTLKALKDRIPRDIALIGFDGIKMTEMMEPEISTIEQPLYQIGVKAAGLLLDRIENKLDDSASSVKLEVKLLQRRSSLGFNG